MMIYSAIPLEGGYHAKPISSHSPARSDAKNDTAITMKPLTGDAILLLTALLWGSGFVAQRLGNRVMEPLAFNAARFLLAGLLLSPWIVTWLRSVPKNPVFWRKQARASIPVVIFLTIGASLQQIGLVSTTAGKGGFLTALYVVFVPFIGIFCRKTTQRRHIVAALVALSGAYFLSVPESWDVNFGDVMVALGAIAWAAHIHSIDAALRKGFPPVALAGWQFLLCGAGSFALSLAIEAPTVGSFLIGWQPIIYSGVIVVSLGYSLQIIGQKAAPPAHAAILLSLEAVFAAILGWLFLDETMSPLAILGSCLILLAVLIAEMIRPTPQSTLVGTSGTPVPQDPF